MYVKYLTDYSDSACLYDNLITTILRFKIPTNEISTCIMVVLFLSACQNDAPKNIQPVITPEEQKLLNQLSAERNQPQAFIKNISEYKKGVLGNMNIFIKVKNEASHMTYKDVKVEIQYLSKTNTALGAPFYETVYESLPPGD